MKRGDIVTVAASGDYGKPRPALVVQSDHLRETDSVLLCLLTSTLRPASHYRLDVPATAETGLALPSQVMVDKIVAARRDRCRGPIGRIGHAELRALGPMLALALGLAD